MSKGYLEDSKIRKKVIYNKILTVSGNTEEDESSSKAKGVRYIQ